MHNVHVHVCLVFVLYNVGPFLSADEVTALLAQAGLFELAIDISKRFSLSMVPIFEALAARSVRGNKKNSTIVSQASVTVHVNINYFEVVNSYYCAISILMKCPWGVEKEFPCCFFYYNVTCVCMFVDGCAHVRVCVCVCVCVCV